MVKKLQGEKNVLEKAKVRKTLCWKKQKCDRSFSFYVVASATSDRRCLLAQVCED